MKRLIILLSVILFVGGLYPTKGHTATFNSGSTGADGAFAPAADTVLTLPPTGIFNFTTINIPTGVTVTFTRNAANTPVTFLATGDVTIAGTIDVSGQNGEDGNSGNVPAGAGGKGGPGGFDGGYGGIPISVGIAAKDAGAGLGPGGGNPGNGVQFNGTGGGFDTDGYSAYNNNPGGVKYGSATLLPLIGGSGGGGGSYGSYFNYYGGGGGGGAGAILIASSGTINITGNIKANGGKGGNGYAYGTGYGSGSGGGGAGGGIRLIANIIAINNNGSLRAYRGNGGTGHYGAAAGSEGRIRIETYNFSSTVTGTISPSPSLTNTGLVSLPQVPTLTITTVGGTPVPATASGSYSSPDITLPSSTTNPVTVVLSASNVPVGTIVKITVAPQYGSSSTVNSTALSGTQASSTATASVNLSTTSPTILMAEATFAVQIAMYYDGEKIERVRVASVMGGKSKVVYITESGKEVPSELLLR